MLFWESQPAGDTAGRSGNSEQPCRLSSDVVPDYRVYVLNKFNTIVSATEEVFADDEAAREGARRLLTKGGLAEIWNRTRCVGQVSVPPP
jgi:hypothetical protein